MLWKSVLIPWALAAQLKPSEATTNAFLATSVDNQTSAFHTLVTLAVPVMAVISQCPKMSIYHTLRIQFAAWARNAHAHLCNARMLVIFTLSFQRSVHVKSWCNCQCYSVWSHVLPLWRLIASWFSTLAIIVFIDNFRVGAAHGAFAVVRKNGNA